MSYCRRAGGRGRQTLGRAMNKFNAPSNESVSDATQSFPSPDVVQLKVRRNSLETRWLLWSIWKDKSSGNVPQAMWNWFQHAESPWVIALKSWYVVYIIWSVLFVSLAVYILASSPNRSGWIVLASNSMNLAALTVPFYAGSQIRRQFAHHLAENAGLVCPDCGYLLHGLPPEHHCPECGRKYSLAGVRQYWLRWMAARRPRDYQSGDATRAK